jgi:hypothetical protein
LTKHLESWDRQDLCKDASELQFGSDVFEAYFSFLLIVAHEEKAHIHVFGALMEHWVVDEGNGVLIVTSQWHGDVQST